MLFLLIFPVLVAGFFACHIHPVYSYKLHRFEGQYLYLNSAKLGMQCFGIAIFIVVIWNYFIPDVINFLCISFEPKIAKRLVDTSVKLWEKDVADAKKSVWFFLLSVMTFCSAFILKYFSLARLWILCKTFDRERIDIFVMGKILEDSPLDNILYKSSLDKDKNIMLSMNDRKVYVGKIISLGEASETIGMDQEILIMPIMSGFRDKDNLKVKFNTYYSDVEQELTLTLRQDAIVSATDFDFDAYEIWNKKAGDDYSI